MTMDITYIFSPQGIVHNTPITILNAARKFLDLRDQSDLGGVLYVTSGLGSMSGAQAKAAVIRSGLYHSRN